MIMFMPLYMLYIPNDDEFSKICLIATIIITIFFAIILYTINDTESTLEKEHKKYEKIKKYEDKER